MRKKRKHKLRTIKDLALHLGITIDSLQDVCRALDFDETRLYKSWNLPKPSGGSRPIDTPKGKLKFIQERINDKVLQRTQISRMAIGGVRGRRLRENLVCHSGKPMVANFDLKSFFSNITQRQVYRTFTLIGLSPNVARMLTRLTTFKGRIPQGAPTSPMLANLVAGYGDRKCLDGRVIGLCDKHKLRPSRWIDDISLSGASYLKKLEPTIERIIEQSGFITNKEKTTFASRDQSQIVTGHSVNIKPNVVKSEKRKVRSLLHNCENLIIEKPSEASIERLKHCLRGKIEHLKSINSQAGIKLLEQFNSIEWPN